MSADHVFADAALSDVDAKFEQFAMDAGCTPKGILPAHFADQVSDVAGNNWSSALAAPYLPSPEQAKGGAMPSYDGFRLTMVSAERQWHQRRERQIHKRRSPDVNFGRAGADLLSTPIWWRRARFSSSTAARERRIEGRIARNLVRKTPDRRRPIHVAVTEYPTAEWVAHQLLEAIPWDSAPRTWSGIGMEAIERGSVRSHTGWVFGKF